MQDAELRVSETAESAERRGGLVLDSKPLRFAASLAVKQMYGDLLMNIEVDLRTSHACTEILQEAELREGGTAGSAERRGGRLVVYSKTLAVLSVVGG